MIKNSYPTPFKIHSEKECLGNNVDLMLGDDEVLVELKFEPNWKITNDQGRVNLADCEADVKKIKSYSNNGKHAHFVMIDDNMDYPYFNTRIENEKDWERIGTTNSLILHKYLKPKVKK
jgi:hypothetical protein